MKEEKGGRGSHERDGKKREGERMKEERRGRGT
jgi:hypothetical protein